METEEGLKQKFKISVCDNIIDLVFLKEETDPANSLRLAQLVREAVLNIFNQNPGQIYNGIIDVEPLKEKVSYLTGLVREVYAGIMLQEQLKNIAIVGGNVFYQAAINFMIKTSRKDENIKWFSDKKEAIEWLKEK